MYPKIPDGNARYRHVDLMISGVQSHTFYYVGISQRAKTVNYELASLATSWSISVV